MTGIHWAFVRAGCPRCGAQRGGERGLHFHSKTVWCLGCGFGSNWDDLPVVLERLRQGQADKGRLS